MVEKLITFSLRNRAIVLLVSACLFVWGIYSVQQNPIDAIPDLSENQVIVFTEWMGRSPQVIEAQVTYPLVSNLQGIPKAKNIRGASMFGMSFVYIIFEDAFTWRYIIDRGGRDLKNTIIQTILTICEIFHI